MVLRKCRPIPLLLVLAWIFVWGCAQTNVRLGEESDAEAPPTSFTPTPDAGDADAPAVEALLCIGTECPEPFATCAAATGPAYKCGTDLARDPKNCGACGNECLVYKPLHMTSRCIEGVCELQCMNEPGYPTDRRNCNGEVDDGCEVDVLVDPKNCGACGNACAAGQPCLKGKCGCPAGQIACGGVCVNPSIDDLNCGECGVECEPPKDACSSMPERAYYGCVGGSCGRLKCGGFSADCNGDVATNTCSSDGCEVADLRTDRNNCGGCGIACAAGEECLNEGFGYECAVPCSRFGKVYCPNTDECVDFLTDPNHCGGCGSFCPAAGANQIRVCDKGLCKYDCAPGFADCNGNTADGCETNLRAHPGNCGSCGNRCDVAEGQPCVEGKCLMTECDGEVTK
ncbi:MAG: hypothetical protein KF795_07330 [Labilithrix sp.]|nr:hypothetical protein [Labilithrix sp.]